MSNLPCSAAQSILTAGSSNYKQLFMLYIHYILYVSKTELEKLNDQYYLQQKGNFEYEGCCSTHTHTHTHTQLCLVYQFTHVLVKIASINQINQ